MEQIANVTKLPLKHRKLRCKYGLGDCTFSFDEKYITIESHNGLDAGPRKYDLWRLIPTPATEQVQRPEAASQVRSGIAFLLVALVIFFSDFRSTLPLLVPVLLVVGAVELAVGYYRIKPRTFTHFFGSDGPAVVSIPTEALEGDRERFIENLSEAIKSARTEAYGTTSV